MSLYELDTKIKGCIQLDAEYLVDTEDGEIFDLQQFEALQMERGQKIEGLCCYIKNLMAEVVAYEAEEKRMRERRAAKEREIDRCKGYLAGVLYGEKFETPRCKVSWRKSEVCNVLSMEEIPDEYKRTKVTVDADKTAIKKAIKAGMEIPGAEVIQKLNMTLK